MLKSSDLVAMQTIDQNIFDFFQDAVGKRCNILISGGTGTGKTYAYLVPALRADRKVIISTGSKALQDQLYARDLPTVTKALKYKGKMALLKGRSNYLCLERLEQQ